MSSVAEVDREKAAEENSALLPAEKPFYDGGLKAVKYPEKFSEVDRLQIVRGYQTYEPRDEETNKAFKMIEDWREEYGYHSFLLKEHELAKVFHTHYWVETIYGTDKFGHVLIGLKYMDIDTNKVCDMDENDLIRIVGQKLASYGKHKDNISKKIGQQRYKQSFIIDLKGGGMGVLNGSKRRTVQKVFSIGSDFFPETVWKIYVYHTPMMFRAIWGIASAFIHPVTKAKVNVLNSAKQVKERLISADGFKEEDVPEMLGGKNKGISSYDIIKQMVEQTTKEQAEAPTADATASSGGDDGEPSQPETVEKPRATLI